MVKVYRQTEEEIQENVMIKLGENGFKASTWNKYLLFYPGRELDEVRLALKSGLLKKVSGKGGHLTYEMHGIPLEKLDYGKLESQLRESTHGSLKQKIHTPYLRKN